ncbi:hypothetical protein OB955_21465 [Halobacteria archaeon AArc-m2/3/4]|uniref:Uncharacterized protein n=1 Tax=Natronoglomus mannanivorans TaxID=2979990 RepID=A0ABT2QK67_9EURY|nr:hypothetical protein [Halobacteria archaeon AArc-m2/3/4]
MALVARPSDAAIGSVLVLLVGLALLGPTVAAEAGFAAPLHEERTAVGEPLEGENVDVDVDIVPYDSLTADEQEIFDEAVETDGSATGTIEGVEYVDREGVVYPVTVETAPASSTIPVLYGTLIVGTIVTAVGLVTTFSTVGMPAYGLLVDLVGPTALIAFWIVVVAVVVWTAFVPFGYEVASISTGPVADSPGNAATVSLADQPADVQQLVRSTLEDSASTGGEVETVELDRMTRLPDEFATAEYLSVDGEYYLLETRNDAGATLQIALVGIFSLVFLTVTTLLTLEFADESDDAEDGPSVGDRTR